MISVSAGVATPPPIVFRWLTRSKRHFSRLVLVYFSNGGDAPFSAHVEIYNAVYFPGQEENRRMHVIFTACLCVQKKRAVNGKLSACITLHNGGGKNANLFTQLVFATVILVTWIALKNRLRDFNYFLNPRIDTFLNIVDWSPLNHFIDKCLSSVNSIWVNPFLSTLFALLMRFLIMQTINRKTHNDTISGCNCSYTIRIQLENLRTL